MIISVNADDIRSIARLIRIVPAHDRSLSVVCAASIKGSVVWVAADRKQIASVRCGRVVGDDVAPIGLPLRELGLLVEFVGEAQGLDLTIRAIGDKGKIELPGYTLSFQSRPASVIEAYNFVVEQQDFKFSADVDRFGLVAALIGAARSPSWISDDQRKQFWLAFDSRSQSVTANSSWVGYPDTAAIVPCATDGDARVAVDPETLLEALNSSQAPRAKLLFGTDLRQPLQILSDDQPAITLMPSRYGVEVDRPEFERVMASIFDLSAPPATDEDGDYPIALRSGQKLYLRLVASDAERRIPSHISMFVRVAVGLEESPETLREVNELNGSYPFACLYIYEGKLFLTADAPLDALNENQLRGTIELIADIAEGLGPTLEGYFGVDAAPPRSTEEGETTDSPDD